MKNKDLLKVKEIIEESGVNDNLEVANYVSVWSNGNKMRRYIGQDNDYVKDSPKKGYRKMVAILVEID